MTKFIKTFAATTMALALGSSAFAGGDSVVGSPVSASVAVPNVTVVVPTTLAGGGIVTSPVASLPVPAQAALQNAVGGSIQTASPLVQGLLTSYFSAPIPGPTPVTPTTPGGPFDQ